ncbi:MAG: tRNA (N(6)-L-threonylcarbamoyladenosine(37)-C(2))-methylthiotransferase MtaB [Candidatus Gracilibacteria bacterium]
MFILLKTLGCKANRYESDKLCELLLGRGDEVRQLSEGVRTLSFDSKAVDVLVVNTCTVTQVADRKSRQVVYGLKRLYPSLQVIVFGCGSNVAPEDYKKLEGVDFVAKNTKEVFEIIEKLDHRNNLGKSSLKRTRALVKIQDGCDNFCTYCIVPKARGRERSFSSKSILKEVKTYEKEGYKEIVLTGINIGEWEEDSLNIADLLEILIQNTKSVRFRVSSIEPKNFSPKFYTLFKTGRLCPHMHMSLQSGSDSVLGRMRRNYLTKEFLEICNKFKKAVPDIGLTTDVIVGFPGETEKEFEETCKFVKKIGFLKIHVFPYSKRKDTAAYYMKDQIPEIVKKQRAEKLRKIADKMSTDFKKTLLGKTYEVLAENPHGKIYKGFTPNYIPVQFLYTEERPITREIVEVTLKKLQKDGTVLGEIA